uniref:AGC-kinase C-terminal domain-containing protein n=1 Tax=Anopheles atroparvus TaxID=41427 RepID=A0A182IP43_ANOAO
MHRRLWPRSFPFTDLSRYLRGRLRPFDQGGEELASPESSVASQPPEVASWELPDAVEQLVPAERDLLQRLLQPVPQHRLRSLLQLERIALYKNYRWDDVRNGKISPKQYIDDECLFETEEDPFQDF